MPREADGYRIEETWDTLGMRATRSDDTILDGAFVPDRYIARKSRAGELDLFVLGAVRHVAAACFGASTRHRRSAPRDLAVARRARRRRSALTRSMAYHPEIQHLVAEMALELEAMGAARRADRRTTGRTAWTTARPVAVKLVALKYHFVESAKRVVDLAMTMSGGARHVQAQRAGAAVPRRALRRLPSRELRCWRTRSSARRRSASTSASSRAGAKRRTFLNHFHTLS